MVNNHVPMTEAHYEAAVQSIEKGDSLWGFLQTENSHVLESTGSGLIYDAGKSFHEGIHAAEAAQQAVSNFVDQTKDAFSSAKESLLSPFQQDSLETPSAFAPHPSDPFSNDSNPWSNGSQSWGNFEGALDSNAVSSAWGWGLSPETNTPTHDGTSSWGNSYDSGYSSHDSGSMSFDSGNNSHDSSSQDNSGSDSGD